MVNRRLRLVLCALAFAAAFSLPVSADHSWGTYHWYRTANPVSIAVGNNLTANWTPYLNRAISDWNTPVGGYTDVINPFVTAGGTSPRTCKPTAGRVEVCNAAYGANGWLGIAQIWISGDHITQGIEKMNDTYFTDAYGYNTPEWRQMVICQEVGHTWGLDHQDEVFSNPNLGTCMDYTSDPSTNQHPNAHDFEQLQIIYTHLDQPSGGGGGGNGRGRGAAPQLPPAASGFVPGDAQREWGSLVRSSRRYGLFHLDLGGGQHVFTFAIWA